MITKSLILGILIFLLDLLIFGYGIVKKTAKGCSPEEMKRLKMRLTFVIPIVLFIQLFFAIVLIFTFQFLSAFKVFEKTIGGGLSYAFIFFVPMLYILLSNLQWGDKEANTKIMPGIISCVVKFSVVGLYLGLVV
ncbi:hypothetical protein ACFL5G_00515 [Candidatus Margulisiibacteriota bacterium]